MPSARETFGPYVRPIADPPDTVVERRTRAAIARSETRLQALANAYADQCSRIRAELLGEIKSIERGF